MTCGKITIDQVKAYYDAPDVVDYYRRATANIGLWASEELVIRRVFNEQDRILELGTGTGRIAIGLAEIGYKHILATELSREMIKEARRIGKCLELSVSFRQADATNLNFEDGLFDGAIFGFNGLMQIPGKEARRKALSEINRVIHPGGALVFTTHDRNNPRHRNYWRDEKIRWNKGKQKPELVEFGDRFEKTELGLLFVHVPVPEEIREDLQSTGWKAEWDCLRSKISHETPATLHFSDDCRFWVARK